MKLPRDCIPRAATAAHLLVSHYTGNIYSVSLTAGATGNGTLAITSTLKGGGTQPSWLSYDAASSTLWSTDEAEYGSPTLTSLKVAADGSVTTLAQAKTEGGAVHGNLYGGSNGTGFWAEAEYDFSSISTYKTPISSSSAVLQRLKFTMSGTGTVPSRQNAPHPHSVFTDPSGKFLISADLGADLIRIFSIDATSGTLTACTAASAAPGDGPRHGAFWTSPSGMVMLFVVNELGNSITSYMATYPASGSTGCLSLARTQSLSGYAAGKTAPAGSKSAEVRVAGNFAYIVNRADQSFGSQQDSVAMYSIDATSGGMAFVEATNTHTYYPRTFAINKAGDLVAFGGQTSSTVAVVRRNVTTGRLGDLVAVAPVGSAGQAGSENGMSAVIWVE